MIFSHRIKSLLLAISILSLSAAAQALAAGKETNATTLNLTSIASLAAIDPVWQLQSPTHPLRPLIAPPFLVQNLKGQWECLLCVTLPKWPEPKTGKEKDRDKDKKNAAPILDLSFEIGPEWVWSNGKQVTGEDVKATVQVLQQTHPDQRIRLVYPITAVKVDPTNPKRFTVTFRRASADWPLFMAMSLLPASDLQGLTEDPQKLVDWLNARQFQANSLSYGPYILTELGTRYHFKVNAQSKRPKPSFEQIIAAQADETEAVKTFNAKNTDAVLDHTWQIPPQTQPSSLSAPSDILEMMVFNLKNPMLSDANLRRAVAAFFERNILQQNGINTVEFAKDFLQTAAVADPQLQYNKDNAINLLQKAGWMKHPEQAGFFKHDQKLRLTLSFNRSNFRQKLAERMAVLYGKAGIELVLDPHSEDSFATDVISKAKYRDIVLLAANLPLPTGFHEMFHSSQILNTGNNFKGKNLANWIDKITDTKIEAVESATNPDTQMQNLTEINKRLLDQLPAIPLFRWTRTLFVADRIKGAQLAGPATPSLVYIDQWKL